MFALERLIQAAAGAPPISLVTERLLIRPPRARDYAEWSKQRRASKRALQPWEPLWSRDHLTERSFRRRVAWGEREIAADRAFPLLVFLQEEDGGRRLVGGVTLENVRRGAAQSAALGYWLGARDQGRGYMTETLGAVTGFAFETLGLSRLEAACLPENARSRRLLERVGFREEARLSAYLEINGVWRDHVLYERRFGARAEAAG